MGKKKFTLSTLFPSLQYLIYASELQQKVNSL